MFKNKTTFNWKGINKPGIRITPLDVKPPEIEEIIEEKPKKKEYLPGEKLLNKITKQNEKKKINHKRISKAIDEVLNSL